MSTDKIATIRKQMAALEKEEAKLLKKSRGSALKEIKALVKANRLTADDLAGLFPKGKKRRGRPPGRPPKQKAAKAKAATGKRRGRPPKVKVEAKS